MQTSGPRPSRRTVLAFGAGATLSTTLVTGAHAAAPGEGTLPVALRRLEREHSARLGVLAHDTATGRTVAHRGDELFPMCSVFKTMAVAAVLRDLDRHGEYLARRVRYTDEDVQKSGYAPITGRPENLRHGMTVRELCAAAVEYSDNTAANLLLRELGGPTAVTRFCRSLGDGVTRLDRYEPELNSAEPWRRTDTTSPRAIARTYARLTLGDALPPGDRELLTRWLLGNTTSGNRFRAGLPDDWTIADRTGTGSYGTTNNVGVTWPPGRAPIVLAVLSTRHRPDAPADEPLVAGAASLVADAFS